MILPQQVFDLLVFVSYSDQSAHYLRY